MTAPEIPEHSSSAPAGPVGPPPFGPTGPPPGSATPALTGSGAAGSSGPRMVDRRWIYVAVGGAMLAVAVAVAIAVGVTLVPSGDEVPGGCGGAECEADFGFLHTFIPAGGEELMVGGDIPAGMYRAELPAEVHETGRCGVRIEPTTIDGYRTGEEWYVSVSGRDDHEDIELFNGWIVVTACDMRHLY